MGKSSFGRFILNLCFNGFPVKFLREVLAPKFILAGKAIYISYYLFLPLNLTSSLNSK